MFTTLISVEELKQHIGQPDVVIIDCRFSLANPNEGRQQYENGHIPGAFYAHLDEDLSGEIIPGTTGLHPLPSPSDFAAYCGHWGINEDSQVIVYDQGHGGIAARLWWMLRWLGHEAVAVLNGGFLAWEKEGGEMSTEQLQAIPREFNAKSQLAWPVEANDVNLASENTEIPLIDSRTAPRYRGKEEPIDPVAGHIPGAINLPFTENLNAEGLWLDKDKLKERFEAYVKGDYTPIFYCGSGVTACHNILALKHAGLGDAYLYPGSWSEWITDNTHGVATETT